MRVLGVIKERGFENPIKSRAIEVEFCLAGATVREIIHYLRTKRREPIGSKNGYFYAKSMSELQNTINDLRSRQRKIRDAELGLCASFQPQEQTSMFDLPQDRSNYEIE
jgi:hypothetical protein